MKSQKRSRLWELQQTNEKRPRQRAIIQIIVKQRRRSVKATSFTCIYGGLELPWLTIAIRSLTASLVFRNLF